MYISYANVFIHCFVHQFLCSWFQPLSVEVEEKLLVGCAVVSTSGNILEEMFVNGVNPHKQPQEAEFVRAKWKELREKIRHLQAELEPSAESFQTFLTSMSQFLCWLRSFYTNIYDDYCVKILQDSSQELIVHVSTHFIML